MIDIFDFLILQMNNLFQLMNRLAFNVGGVTVYYGWLCVAMVIISIATSYFWKGGRG